MHWWAIHHRESVLHSQPARVGWGWARPLAPMRTGRRPRDVLRPPLSAEPAPPALADPPAGGPLRSTHAACCTCTSPVWWLLNPARLAGPLRCPCSTTSPSSGGRMAQAGCPSGQQCRSARVRQGRGQALLRGKTAAPDAPASRTEQSPWAAVRAWAREAARAAPQRYWLGAPARSGHL